MDIGDIGEIEIPDDGPPRDKKRRREKISEVGNVTEAGLACPKCGGTQFKAKRSRGAKVLLSPMAITIPLAPKTRVKCVTCGTEYRRG
jgi:hypothetical protein